MMPALAIVRSTGDVFWPVPTKLQSSCKIDVTYFPFDQQMCLLKFGTWTYDGFKVNVTKLRDNIDTNTYVPNGEWELIKTEKDCPNPFTQ
ncbi:unnamed protein product [Protopolystoma xenopodis]|uniref:Neurotransmitter-gated ion-channel ligand-binding domain-containing protein n=1 Tax=Protopolystoma xenopodis TaxID=117903 RepID=A0A448WEQ6_9PLAT|nr:unnamed protein product [Protopolystoma xenopodis]